MSLADDAFRIRPSVRDDRRAMHALLRRTWKDAYGGFLERKLALGVLTGTVKLETDWHEGFGTCVGEWIAERGSRLIGLATLGESADGDGELVQLYVLPSNHGFGVGTALWEACLAEARLQQWNGLRLWAFERGPAVGFYQRRGAVFVRRSTARLGEHEEPILGMRVAL